MLLCGQAYHPRNENECARLSNAQRVRWVRHSAERVCKGSGRRGAPFSRQHISHEHGSRLAHSAYTFRNLIRCCHWRNRPQDRLANPRCRRPGHVRPGNCAPCARSLSRHWGRGDDRLPDLLCHPRPSHPARKLRAWSYANEADQQGRKPQEMAFRGAPDASWRGVDRWLSATSGHSLGVRWQSAFIRFPDAGDSVR